jgi:hypothetical protein
MKEIKDKTTARLELLQGLKHSNIVVDLMQLDNPHPLVDLLKDFTNLSSFVRSSGEDSKQRVEESVKRKREVMLAWRAFVTAIKADTKSAPSTAPATVLSSAIVSVGGPGADRL